MSELVSGFWPAQPEPGSVGDQLIKKGEAREEARREVRGEKKASIRPIRILQSILGVAESTDEELVGKSLEGLGAMIEDLQQQVSERVK